MLYYVVCYRLLILCVLDIICLLCTITNQASRHNILHHIISQSVSQLIHATYFGLDQKGVCRKKIKPFRCICFFLPFCFYLTRRVRRCEVMTGMQGGWSFLFVKLVVLLIWYAQHSTAVDEAFSGVLYKWPLTFIVVYWIALVVVCFVVSMCLERSACRRQNKNE